MNILLVEDEKLFAKSVQRRLEREGHFVTVCEQLAQAEHSLSKQIPDIILLDVRLPDGSGLDFLKNLKSKPDAQTISVIMMTAFGELEDAVSAMKLGASDYLKKPVDLDELVLTLGKVASQHQINQKLDYSTIRETHQNESAMMIGFSSEIVGIKSQIDRIAQLSSQSSTPPLVLIRGETGTGKDVLAHVYHHAGNWNHKPFVHVDCASLPEHLIEAELFGYERGAFTNAHHSKAGLIEAAEDGTLFLDEIGELPLELQAKLLNVLERRKVRRLGSTRELSVGAHFVTATNRDLFKMVKEGCFRSDLYYRLNVLELVLPALRERTSDILPLAAYFTETIAKRYGLSQPSFTQSAIDTLMSYSWPGNIRELQHVLERAVMLCNENQIDSNHLLLSQQVQQTEKTNKPEFDVASLSIEEVEKMMITKALDRTAGNVSRAAREVGLTRMALRYRMEKYKL